ncbi:MAG: toll/interleukin-1 receptor domain-containing protein [Planctomycetaceae bacterium]
MSSDNDLFFSYKSDDIMWARPVVEALQASGLRVWFAEYYVLPESYHQFQDAIDLGVRSARFGLLLISEQWYRSVHCLAEAKALLSRLEPSRVLIVRLPGSNSPDMDSAVVNDDHLVSLLMRCPQYAYFGVVGELLDFIRAHTGLSAKIPLRNSEEQPIYVAPPDPLTGLSFCFRKGFLDAIDETPSGRQDRGRTAIYGYGQVSDRRVRMVVQSSASRPVIDSLAVTETIDDRVLYQNYREYANQRFLKPRQFVPIGLHLFRYENRGQFAITYRYPGENALPTWERRYVIAISDHLGVPAGEVDFVFAVDLPESDEALAIFCGITPALDAVVQSFYYQLPNFLHQEGGRLTHNSWPFALQVPYGAELIFDDGRAGIRHRLTCISVYWGDRARRAAEIESNEQWHRDQSVPHPKFETIIVEHTRTTPWYLYFSIGCVATVGGIVLGVLTVLILSIFWVWGLAVAGCVLVATLVFLTLIGPTIRYSFTSGSVPFQIKGPYLQRRRIEKWVRPVFEDS